MTPSIRSIITSSTSEPITCYVSPKPGDYYHPLTHRDMLCMRQEQAARHRASMAATAIIAYRHVTGSTRPRSSHHTLLTLDDIMMMELGSCDEESDPPPE